MGGVGLFAGKDRAGGMGSDRGRELTLDSGDAGSEGAGKRGCHVDGNLICAFGEEIDEEVGRAVFVLAVEACACAPGPSGKLVDRLEGCGAAVDDCDIAEVAGGFDGQKYADLLAEADAVDILPTAVAEGSDALFDGNVVGRSGLDFGGSGGVARDDGTVGRTGGVDASDGEELAGGVGGEVGDDVADGEFGIVDA